MFIAKSFRNKQSPCTVSCPLSVLEPLLPSFVCCCHCCPCCCCYYCPACCSSLLTSLGLKLKPANGSLPGPENLILGPRRERKRRPNPMSLSSPACYYSSKKAFQTSCFRVLELRLLLHSSCCFYKSSALEARLGPDPSGPDSGLGWLGLDFLSLEDYHQLGGDGSFLQKLC